MDQKTLFNDALVSLVEYASGQGNRLSKQEIQNHFKEISLEEKQYELIYSYLSANKITIDGFSEEGINIFSEQPSNSENEDLSDVPAKTAPLEESQEELSFINMYLKELDTIPPADDDEKRALVTQLLDGNKDVANRLVELHLHLVAEAAKKMRGQGVTFGDLIQEGNVGLMQAVSSFNHSCGDFDTYILKAVENALKNAINTQVSSDRIGQHLADKLNQLDKVTKELSHKLGRIPEISELAKAMSISEDETSWLLKTSLDTLSINEDTQITDEEKTEAVPKEDPLTWRINKQ